MRETIFYVYKYFTNITNPHNQASIIFEFIYLFEIFISNKIKKNRYSCHLFETRINFIYTLIKI